MAVTFRKKAKKPFAAPWPQLKEDWIVTNLDPERKETYTLQQLALKWSVRYKTLAAISAKEHWYEQLAERKTEIAEQSIRNVQSLESFNETEVRIRQASIAREAYDLGLKKLRMLTPEMVTPRLMVELLRLGLDNERKALGLPDSFTFVPGAASAEDGQYKSVLEHINDQAKLKAMSAKLLRFAERVKE